MNNRDYRISLEDILQSITKIENYMSEFSYDDFIQNGLVFDAVIGNLEVIGEQHATFQRTVRKNILKSHGTVLQVYAIS